MQIALINDNPTWGGGERWFADAASALAQRGHEVRGAARAPLYARWREAGIECFRFESELERSLLPLPDVVLCNAPRDVRAVLAALDRLRTRHWRPPAVILRRGLDKRLAGGWLRWRIWRRLDRIIVNSEASRKTVEASLPWYPPERIVRIYNPVRFEPLPPEPPAQPGLRVGAVGRLTPQKGFDWLLEAFARLDPALDARLVIAGEGKSRPALEQQIERLGLGSRCRLLGHVEDVRTVYRDLDLVVIPSRYEGFCFTAIEAAFCRLAVVATRTSSLPEVVAEGETGLLVEPGDIEALCRAIETLGRDPERRRTFGERARTLAEERFRPEPLYDELERTLERAARQRRPS